jgi:hypothetical protein
VTVTFIFIQKLYSIYNFLFFVLTFDVLKTKYSITQDFDVILMKFKQFWQLSLLNKRFVNNFTTLLM